MKVLIALILLLVPVIVRLPMMLKLELSVKSVANKLPTKV